MKDPKEYLGPSTLEKMKLTKWYALARFLEEMLYQGGDVHAEGSAGSEMGYEKLRKLKAGDNDFCRKFIVTARLYTAGLDKDVTWMGKEGDYCDVQKTLRELAHECERMAIREVT